jgi:hexokinase
MTIDQLKDKLAEAIRNRDAFVEQVNRQLAAENGAIAMLEQLIADMEATDEGDGE